MSKAPERTVKVAELKARLSAYLRAVRRGHALTVCDRDTPVARLVPYRAGGDQFAVREPLHALHHVRLPKPLGKPIDSLAALRDERQSSR